MGGRRQGSVHEGPGTVLGLAWPIASAMLGETLMGLVDTKLVGALGPSALGGVGIANAVFHLCFLTLLGLMRGVKVCTAHALGAGMPSRGRRFALAGVALGLSVGGLLGALFPAALPLLRAVHVREGLEGPAMAFLSARGIGLPATCALAALVEHRQGRGDVRAPMLVGLGGNLVNLPLAWALIHGHAGLPALGVAGAGLATTATEWLQLGVMAALFAADRGAPEEGRAAPLPWRRAFAQLLGVGLPTALHFGCEMLAFVTFTAVLGGMTAADIAAHQIASAINRFNYTFGAAIGEAACILVGRALGARRLDEADRAVADATRLAATFMVASGIAVAAAGPLVARRFTGSAEVAEIVGRLLWLSALWQLMDAFNIVHRCGLRGAKDVRAAAAIGIGVLWGCVPASVVLLGRVAGWGVVGGWLGFLLSTSLAAALYVRRWRRGAWRRAFSPAAAG